MGFYLTFYVYIRLHLYFSNYEEYRIVSGGKWECFDTYWSKIGYYEALNSTSETISISHSENAIENG
jgi:hypothetical protein